MLSPFHLSLHEFKENFEIFHRMYITNDLREDAFGAQYQSILWTILFAECNNLEFLYSDIVRMLGDYGSPDEKIDTSVKYLNVRESEKEFVKKATEYMNLKGNYRNVDSVGKAIIMAPKWPYFYGEIENNMERFHDSPSFKKIQSLFFAKKQTPFDSSHIHVAVHVRRKAQFDSRNEGNSTPHAYFIHCMESIVVHLKHQERPILFHIYSQAGEDEFQEYKRFSIQLHLQDDVFETFTGMAFADYLIMAESSLSYTAGLLSKGRILYKPFWHPPRKDWILIQ